MEDLSFNAYCKKFGKTEYEISKLPAVALTRWRSEYEDWLNNMLAADGRCVKTTDSPVA